MKLKFRAEKKDVVIFLIFCIFLLYLVAIAVLNLHSFAVDGEIWGLNPGPAFRSDFIFYTLVFYILTLVALMLACSSYFFEREEGFGFTTELKSKNDGYSKLLTEREMKKERGIVKIHLKDEDYPAGGLPFINNGVDAWVDDKGEPHALVMGASGSGKTQQLMFPLVNILARHGESIIVTDPKGELYEGCGKLLQEKGYKIILLNFRDPNEGSAWNPFSYPYRVYKEGNVDKANELLQDLAKNILVDPNNKAEPFWEQTASNFFTGLSLGLFDDATEEEVNINSVNMMAEVGEDRFGSSNYIKEYFKSKGELSPAYIAAASCINAPNETRGGIMSTFRTKTRIFSSQENLSEMLSYSDFDIRDIGKEKTAVFLKVHDEKTTYHALATIFVKQCYEALIAVAQTCPKLKLPYRTNFILDEFANMPALNDIGTMITASRSRNIRFTFAIQNFSQLNQVYGKDVAETIKGNCGNFVYIMSTELAALEEISKLLGDKKPDKPKKDEPAPPIRPLFTVSDLQALKQNEVIFNRFRSMPFKTKLTPNWQIDWGKKYEDMGYTTRPKRQIKVFDLKGFVTKLKGDQPTGMPGMPGMGGGMGMPNMMGMPMTGGYVPGGMRSQPMMSTSLDDYVKKLDEQIAKLEKEQAEEERKEREAAAKKAEENKAISNTTLPDSTTATPVSSNRTEEEVAKEINDIFEHKSVASQQPVVNINIDTHDEPKKEEKTLSFVLEDDDDEDDIEEIISPTSDVKEEPIPELPKDDELEDLTSHEEVKPVVNIEVNNTPVVEVKPNPRDGERQEPTYDDVEKPKVNIDVDSVVVNNHTNNEDFFDDFFGGEDE